MESRLIRHFEPDADRLAVIKDCIDDYPTEDPEAEWPCGILSKRTVVYGSGAIARQGDPLRHNIDPDELALCRRLAVEADVLLKDIGLGLRSESHQDYRGFYIAANADESVSEKIDAELIRSKFGGTIFPPAVVLIDRLGEESEWWPSILQSAEIVAEDEEADREMRAGWKKSGVLPEGASDEPDEALFLDRWRAMLRWFRETPQFRDTAFVAIGDYDHFHQLPRDQYPPGTKMIPCTFPRLFLGLTTGGSLVGLFGSVGET